jgi:hypothetical protein
MRLGSCCASDAVVGCDQATAPPWHFGGDISGAAQARRQWSITPARQRNRGQVDEFRDWLSDGAVAVGFLFLCVFACGRDAIARETCQYRAGTNAVGAGSVEQRGPNLFDASKEEAIGTAPGAGRKEIP